MSKLGEKLLKMADRAETEAARKRGPRLENTPKRQREVMSARIDAALLERVGKALRKLAALDGEGLGMPEYLQPFTVKERLTKALTTKLNHGGYYSISDTGEYHDQSPEAVKFRKWLEAMDTPEEIQRQKEQAERTRIQELENKVRFQNIPGFFPTPPDVCEIVIRQLNLRAGLSVLEPSAGKGDLAQACRTALIEAGDQNTTICCVERNQSLCEITQAKGLCCVCNDFLSVPVPEGDAGRYDRIAMNPPFENGQDMDHVNWAFKFLKPGGRLVAVMSPAFTFREGAKHAEFREWLIDVGGYYKALPEGCFSGSDAFRQTGVRPVLVWIDRV